MIEKKFNIKIIETVDIGEVNKRDEELSLEDLLALPHPLEQDGNNDLAQIIEQYFPGKDYVRQLIAATQPSISNNPDSLEKWEAEVILRRKQRAPNDVLGISYLVRLLYEETFSVKQFQGEKQESQGVTPGGLLSHHLFRGSINNISMRTIQDLPEVDGTDLEQVLQQFKIKGYDDLEKFVTILCELTFPSSYHSNRGSKSFSRIMNDLLLRHIITKKDGPLINSNIISIIGLRMFTLIQKNPELLASVQDKLLLKICNVKQVSNSVNLLWILNNLWGMLGHSPRVFFAEGGYYRNEISSTFLKGLEDLIKFRINPNTQILYKYLSPSGYINEHR